MFLAALLVLAGCIRRGGRAGPSDPDTVEIVEPIPPSFEPIVFPNARPGGSTTLAGRVTDDAAVDEDDLGWREKFELASGYAAGGFDMEAFEVIRQTLAMNPPAGWHAKLTDLRATLRIRQLETTFLRADVRGDRDYVPFQTDVEFQVRIRNVSNEKVVLATPEGASPSALIMRIVRRDLDIYAASLKREWTQTVFLQQPGGCNLVIPPGGIHVQKVRVPAVDIGCPISGLRILEVGGTLRASVMRTDDEPGGLALPLRPGRVVVLPAGFEPLTKDPVRSMAHAREVVAPPHFLVAAEFVPLGRLGEGVQEVATTLEHGDPALRTAALGALSILRDRAVGRPLSPLAKPFLEGLSRGSGREEGLMEALAVLSGTHLPPDTRLWQDWGRRIAKQGATVPGPEDGEGA